MTATTEQVERTRPTFRHATWRNLALTYVAAVVVMTLQGVGHALHDSTEHPLTQVPFTLASGVVVIAIVAVVLAVARRSARPAVVGAVAVALALLVWPVTYYLPLAFDLGVTSYLLSRDSAPGRAAATARVLGIAAVALQVLLVVLRFAGVTFEVR